VPRRTSKYRQPSKVSVKPTTNRLSREHVASVSRGSANSGTQHTSGGSVSPHVGGIVRTSSMTRSSMSGNNLTEFESEGKFPVVVDVVAGSAHEREIENENPYRAKAKDHMVLRAGPSMQSSDMTSGGSSFPHKFGASRRNGLPHAPKPVE